MTDPHRCHKNVRSNLMKNFFLRLFNIANSFWPFKKKRLLLCTINFPILLLLLGLLVSKRATILVFILWLLAAAIPLWPFIQVSLRSNHRFPIKLSLNFHTHRTTTMLSIYNRLRRRDLRCCWLPPLPCANTTAA